jgi:hypothetical protein
VFASVGLHASTPWPDTRIAFKYAENNRIARRAEGCEAEVEGFRDELGPFMVAAKEHDGNGVHGRDVTRHPIIFANDAFLALTGAPGTRCSARTSIF